jgi:hypothetical protein
MGFFIPLFSIIVSKKTKRDIALIKRIRLLQKKSLKFC